MGFLTEKRSWCESIHAAGERGERIPAPSPRAAPSSAATRAVGAEARRLIWMDAGGRGVIGAGEGGRRSGGRWWVGEPVRVEVASVTRPHGPSLQMTERSHMSA